MNILIPTILYTVHLIVEHSNCLSSLDLKQNREAFSNKWALKGSDMYEAYPRKKGLKSYRRRFWPKNDKLDYNIYLKASRRVYEDEKDANIKTKVATLVHQTIHDTENKMKDIEKIKEQYRDQSTYRIGFVISTVKKSRDVLNELFDVAIKHREEWKTLEQLKIFELIMHTNVDITHYVKMIDDIHEARDPDKDKDPLTNNTEITDEATIPPQLLSPRG